MLNFPSDTNFDKHARQDFYEVSLQNLTLLLPTLPASLGKGMDPINPPMPGEPRSQRQLQLHASMPPEPGPPSETFPEPGTRFESGAAVGLAIAELGGSPF